jgi:hypothetical protein
MKLFIGDESSIRGWLPFQSQGSTFKHQYRHFKLCNLQCTYSFGHDFSHDPSKLF